MKIIYTINNGALPITVNIVGTEFVNTHTDFGTYFFENVPNQEYSILFTDSDNCIYETEISPCTDCPPGYTAVGADCILYDEKAVTLVEPTLTIIAETKNDSYSSYGMLLFDSWNYDGTGNYEKIWNSYWKNDWTYNGPLNRTAVWASVHYAPQDIGFSFCVNVAVEKTYYVGFACDNWGKVKLNGQMILEQDVNALANMIISNGDNYDGWSDRIPFRYWYIYPVHFSAGQNILEVFGHNETLLAAAIGLQIYDATPTELKNATSDADLAGKILFDSIDLVGTELQYEYSLVNGYHGYYCEDGYALDTCGDTVKCVKRDVVPCNAEITTSTTTSTTTTSTTTISTTTTSTTTFITSTTSTTTTSTTTNTTTTTTSTTSTTSTTTFIEGCIDSQTLFTDTLTFTPATVWYSGTSTMGSTIVEDANYYFIVFSDSQDLDYKYHQVYRRNKTTGVVTTKQIMTTNGYGTDYHKIPVSMITSSGTLLVVIEQLKASGNDTHNSYFDVFRWTDVNDLDTYQQDSLTSAYGSYPWLLELGGSIYLDFRYGLSSSDHYRRAYYKSTDDGDNWSAPVIWANYGDTDYWLYSAQVLNNIPAKDYMIYKMNPQINGNDNYPYTIFVKTNFEEVYALDGTDLGNLMTGAEMEANYTYGDTTKSTQQYGLSVSTMMNNYTYHVGTIGSRISRTSYYTGYQLVRVNTATGQVDLGPIHATSEAYSGYVFNYCGEIVFKRHIADPSAYEGYFEYYRIPQDLSDLEYLYTENADTGGFHRGLTLNLYSQLAVDFNPITNEIRVLRHSEPDDIVTITTTTSTTTTTTTTCLDCTTTTTTTSTTTTSTTTVVGTGLLTGLVSVWEFDESTDTGIVDSHSSLDGINSGGTVNQPSIIGTAYDFTASADYAYIPHDASINFDGYTDSYSVSIWFKTTSSNAGRLLEKRPTGSGQGSEFPIRISYSPTSISCNIYDGINIPTASVSGTFDDGQWHLAVMVVDNNAGTLTMYVDDLTPVSVANTTTESTVSTESLFIHASSGGSPSPFDVLITQIGIWSLELNSDRVASLFNSNNGLPYINW